MPSSLEVIQKYEENKVPIHFSKQQMYVPQDVYDAYLNHPEKRDPEVSMICMEDIWELVKKHYQFPYELYDYQRYAVDAFGTTPSVGLWFEVGTGKTPTAVALSLAHKIMYGGKTIVVMPPILIVQWYRFLQQIGGVGEATMYRGTVAQRNKISLDSDFTLMSIDIFKNDFEKLYEHFKDENVTLVVDEAVSVKNPNTQNHLCVWSWHNEDLTRYNLEKKKREIAKKRKAAAKSGEGQEKAAKVERMDTEAVKSVMDAIKKRFGR